MNSSGYVVLSVEWPTGLRASSLSRVLPCDWRKNWKPIFKGVVVIVFHTYKNGKAVITLAQCTAATGE